MGTVLILGADTKGAFGRGWMQWCSGNRYWESGGGVLTGKGLAQRCLEWEVGTGGWL